MRRLVRIDLEHCTVDRRCVGDRDVLPVRRGEVAPRCTETDASRCLEAEPAKILRVAGQRIKAVGPAREDVAVAILREDECKRTTRDDAWDDSIAFGELDIGVVVRRIEVSSTDDGGQSMYHGSSVVSDEERPGTVGVQRENVRHRGRWQRDRGGFLDDRA